MYRKTYVEIDEDQLRLNAAEIIKKYPDYKTYFGVVKNNAYHHGIRVVNSLIKGGINYLAVSSLEEAIEIRHYNNTIPILVLEPIDLEFIDDVINHNVTISIDSLAYLKELTNLNLPYKINIHLKVDSGMNRLGIKTTEEFDEAIALIKENKKLFLEGIYTHLATSGISDKYYDEQIQNFLAITKNIDLKTIPIVHVDRSLTFVTHEKLAFVNGVRLGIALFGFSGSRPKGAGLKAKLRELKRQALIKRNNISPTILENDLDLKTAFRLYTTVMSLRSVKKGEFVGYNASYQVKEDGFVATLPVGYADGVTKDFGYVVINKKRYPIISDSMDMIMVLVDKSVKLKDKVEILGDTISIKEVTQKLGVNAYHLFNQISNRVPRIHKLKDKEIEIKY